MTRRKSVCLKWTLVLIVVVFSPSVYLRPQEISSQSPITSSSTNSVQTDKATENPIRYRFRKDLSLGRFKLPIVIGSINKIHNESIKVSNHLMTRVNDSENADKYFSVDTTEVDGRRSLTNRRNRLITNKLRHENVINSKRKVYSNQGNKNKDNVFVPNERKRPTIKKVITKWTDQAKYEDLDFSYETSTSAETEEDMIAFTNTLSVNDYSSTENIIDDSTEVSEKHPQSTNKISAHVSNKIRYKHRPQHPEGSVVHSNKVHIIDQYPFPSVRPTYIFTTPTPTPIITNLGDPKPWSEQHFQTVHRRPTTQKPVRVTKPLKSQYNTHNSVHNYPQYSNNNFEVTTFQPSNAYTERIVIRPEEYSATSDDCPTIYLTLNNTFQGQAKEACPDLNIAVNTNVINKNVVVESEEEEGVESLFPGTFGFPIGEDSAATDAEGNDYFESGENQEQPESASVEETEFSNYNAANGAIQADSSELGAIGSFNSPSAPIRRPGRPNKQDDDLFSVSGLVSFFRPALNGMSWLAAISPLSFGVMSLFLTPLALLLAGYSGVAALFAPLVTARKAPKIVHVYRPHWEWDDQHKTWHLNSFPDNRRWRPRLPRTSNATGSGIADSVISTWFYKIQEWMKAVTKKLRDRKATKNLDQDNRKNKRMKRETWTRHIKDSSTKKVDEIKKPEEPTTPSPATPNSSRNVKTKSPVIGESIKMVASQLLESPSNTTMETPIVTDTRIPPKLKNQLAHKNKIKRHDDGEQPTENSHAGIAVPVTMEELETENKLSEIPNESSTSNEGISTWILLSNPMNKENATTEPTKTEEPLKKPKPTPSKNKPKRPQNNKVAIGKRPIIGSTNKSDLIAGGSAINENVYNKIKDTVLSNVQKNKNSSMHRTTTVSTTTPVISTEASTTKKEVITKAPSAVVPVIKVTSKPTKKKNKNKQKTTTTSTTVAPVINESALLPMEPKEQEIELEISTPAATTKKPKRNSTRKKNKTKKRKTSKPKPDSATSVSEIKTSNKTKSNKKKPSATSLTGPITSQLYNYFSREVMPSVGVGVLGLASLVGLAGYFLYPFSSPVRRTFEVDKKDDIYRHNAEEYANEGNGQAEEEMLGTVLAGMPAHSKHKLNPYAGQTAQVNRYPQKKEQDIRYRHVATKYEPNYNVHYPQQKTGIAHGAVYPESVNYNPQQYETRHVYTTESKYVYDKGPAAYTPHPAVEPIYAAPQIGPTGISAYGSETSNSVVYGVKPSSDSDFKPVYPYEGQFHSEVTTSSSMAYQPTSMYLGSNDESDNQEENKYDENPNPNGEAVDNKFVVGNVPKELVDSETPAVVPEHGPRNLNRRKRNTIRHKRSISGSLEEILKEARENKKDILLSNEIDEALAFPIMNVAPLNEAKPMKNDVEILTEIKNIYPVYAVSAEPMKEEQTTTEIPTTTVKTEIVESVSTLPLENTRQEKTTTESDMSNDLETTTKTFRVYEVFSSNISAETEQNSPLTQRAETTTQFKNMNTETTTELRSETTSTMPPSPSPISDSKLPLSTTPAIGTPKPTNNPEVLTYPPLNQDGGFFTFLKRLIEFKYRLGLSILQTTSDNLNRYLRSMENSARKAVKAST